MNMELAKSLWPEYRIWAAMKSRCKNTNDSNYSKYGARGIRVCRAWRKFDNFIIDIGRRPSKIHSLDRINNDGDYKPSNCRWATKQQQSINQRMRVDNTSGYRGVCLNYKKWTPYLSFKGKTYPFGSYATAEEAAYIYDQVALQLFGIDAQLNLL